MNSPSSSKCSTTKGSQDVKKKKRRDEEIDLSKFSDIKGGNNEYIEMVRSLQTAYKREEAILKGELVPRLSDWSPLDTSFTYYKKDIRVTSFTGTLEFKILKFVNVSRLICSLISDTLAFNLDDLHFAIRDYVATIPKPTRPKLNSTPMYEKDEVVLFLVPPWEEVCKVMCKAIGLGRWEALWDKEPCIDEDDRRMTNTWMRGYIKEHVITKFKNKDKVCNVFIIRSLENGRKLPVPWDRIRKCVFKFAFPPQTFTFVSLLLTSEKQYDKEADYKWNVLLSRHKTIKVKVVTNYDENTAVRLIEPTEDQLNKEWLTISEEPDVKKNMPPPSTPPGCCSRKNMVRLRNDLNYSSS